VAPHVDYFATHKPASIAEAWTHDPADSFPLDLATVYRWFKRLTFRLTFLLARFEKELLDLAPETDLLTLEKLIVKCAAIRRTAPSPHNSRRSLSDSSMSLFVVASRSLPVKSARENPPRCGHIRKRWIKIITSSSTAMIRHWDGGASAQQHRPPVEFEYQVHHLAITGRAQSRHRKNFAATRIISGHRPRSERGLFFGSKNRENNSSKIWEKNVSTDHKH
jgi:hypothetical protein